MTITLASFSKGFKKVAPFMIIHGQPGVGKSSFMACAPGVVFADVEKKADSIGPDRLPISSWQEFTDMVKFLLTQEHSFKTFVIDTLDALEPLLHKEICARNGWKNISQPGFGKGELAAKEEWGNLIATLDALRTERRMIVAAIAHSHVKTFNNPEGNDYDRWEMKLDRKASALFMERSSVCLFAMFDVAIKAEKTKHIGLSTGERIIQTTHSAAWDAKNTMDLPAQIEFPSAQEGWDNFAGYLRAFNERKSQPTTVNTATVAA